jgi:hypothetical protein
LVVHSVLVSIRCAFIRVRCGGVVVYSFSPACCLDDLVSLRSWVSWGSWFPCVLVFPGDPGFLAFGFPELLRASWGSCFLGKHDIVTLSFNSNSKLPVGEATEAVSTDSTSDRTSRRRSSHLRHQKRVVVRELTSTVTALGSRRASNATSAGAHQKCPPATKSLATNFHRG